MSVPCVTQARIFSPRRRRGTATTTPVVWSWSLPVWICPMESSSVRVNDDDDDVVVVVDNPDVVLHSRIATPLGIQDGDDVTFDLVDCGERFTRQMTVVDATTNVNDTLAVDFVINDALSTGIAIKASVSSKTKKGITTTETTLMFQSGKQVQLPGQDLWTTATITNTASPILRGRGVLHYSGVCRNKAGTGFGYSISSATSQEDTGGSALNPTVGPDLVNGYCYCGPSGTSQQMERAGAVEALEWALRFHFEKLWIRGDSMLVFQQLSGEEAVTDEVEQSVEYKRLEALLDKAEEERTQIFIDRIPEEANVISNVLANLAIDLKENATACCWLNIHELCTRPRSK